MVRVDVLCGFFVAVLFFAIAGGAAREGDAKLFELAIQMGAFQPNFLCNAAHVVIFLANVEFKIASFQLFAQFAQGKVEIEYAADIGEGFVGVELVEQARNGDFADFVLFAVQYQAVDHIF